MLPTKCQVQNDGTNQLKMLCVLFKTGLQYGIGVKFGNIEVDVRAERSFTKNEIKFMENRIGEKNQYVSTQGKLYLLGISYYF